MLVQILGLVTYQGRGLSCPKWCLAVEGKRNSLPEMGVLCNLLNRVAS